MLSLVLAAGGKALKWFTGTKLGKIALAVMAAGLVLLTVYGRGKSTGREQEQIEGLKRDNDALRRMQDADADAPSTRPGVVKRLRDGTF